MLDIRETVKEKKMGRGGEFVHWNKNLSRGAELKKRVAAGMRGSPKPTMDGKEKRRQLHIGKRWGAMANDGMW